MKSGKNYFIAGYFGFGNVGDEAVLTVIIDDIRSLDPKANIAITAERTEHVLRIHPEVERVVYWRNTNEVVSAILASDCVVIGGGGLWNSYFDYGESDCLERTDNYAFHIFNVPILARCLQKQVIVYAVGGGQIVGEYPRKQAALALECASIIMVRDQRTQEFFLSLGIEPENVHVTGDPAFRLSMVVKKNETSGQMLDVGPIIVNLRQWLNAPAGFELAIARELGSLSKGQNLPLLFVPFDVSLHADDGLSDDIDLCRRVMSLLPADVEARVSKDEPIPEVVNDLLAQASLVVSMRLHGNILAIGNAIPAIGIAYDNKVEAVFEDLGLADFVLSPEEAIRPGNLSRLSNHVLSHDSKLQMAKARELAIENSARSVSVFNTLSSRPEDMPVSAGFEQFRNDMLVANIIEHTQLKALAQSVGNLTRNCISARNWADAFALTSALEEAFPSSGEWPYLRSVSGLAIGRDSLECLAGFGLALDLGYNPGWVLFHRAQCLFDIGRLDEAEADIAEARRIDPSIPDLDTVVEWINEAKKKQV